jgi:hypothetical protein
MELRGLACVPSEVIPSNIAATGCDGFKLSSLPFSCSVVTRAGPWTADFQIAAGTFKGLVRAAVGFPQTFPATTSAATAPDSVIEAR